MGKRQLRQDAIRELVRTHEVRTQQDLVGLLAEEGFKCTQSTVSRDIVELSLKKTKSGRYLLPEEMRLIRIVSELVFSVQAAGNLIVVKTQEGGAQGVADALDKTDIVGVLGSVAGDNTIFLAADTPENARLVAELIGENLNTVSEKYQKG